VDRGQVLTDSLGLLVNRHVVLIAYAIALSGGIGVECRRQRLEVVRLCSVLAIGSKVFRSAASEERAATTTRAMWRRDDTAPSLVGPIRLISAMQPAGRPRR
jgi:hypothetical protein